MNHLIKLSHLAIGYKKKEILSSIEMEVNKGDYIAIIGPNGAGKSTLVKTILSVLPPVKGKLDFKEGIRFGYVPQRKSIPNHYPLSAFDIALMGRYKNKLLSHITTKDKEIVKKNFEELQISHLLYKQYAELSGGEKQRVLIAKALSIEPDILILDEPTSAMDLVSEHHILQLLADLNQKKHLTIMMITHHLLHINDQVSHLVFINKENKTFMAGKKSDVFTEEKLSQLYGQPIHFQKGTEVMIGEKLEKNE